MTLSELETTVGRCIIEHGGFGHGTSPGLCDACRQNLLKEKKVESLTVAALVDINRSRAKRWHPIDGWSPMEWGCAMAGEVGEACNAAKKLARVEQNIAHIDDRLERAGVAQSADDSMSKDVHMEMKERYREQIGNEVADTVIYGVLLCERVGADLEASLRRVFNNKSEEYGFPERL